MTDNHSNDDITLNKLL